MTLADIIPTDGFCEYVETDLLYEDLRATIGCIDNEIIRSTLIARYWIGKPARKIAKEYEVAPLRVYSLLRKGLATLREDIKVKQLATEMGYEI